MSSINEWKRRNNSLDAINKQLSEKILVLEAEIEQLKKRAALDEDFSKYIDSRDELMAKKEEYIQTLVAENEKLKGERDELEKNVNIWKTQAEKTSREYREMEKKMEEQESKLADISDRYIFSTINEVIEKGNYKAKYESLKKNIKRDDNNSSFGSKNSVLYAVCASWLSNAILRLSAMTCLSTVSSSHSSISATMQTTSSIASQMQSMTVISLNPRYVSLNRPPIVS